MAALGGILLLFSAYFTARNLLYSSRAGFLDRFMRASELLREDDPVKRAAGRAALSLLLAQARSDDDKAVVRVVLDADKDAPIAR